MNAKTHCKFLTNTRHFTYDVVKPCCWIKDIKFDIADIDSINQGFKRLNKINDWIPECSYCYDLEAAGTTSPRTQAEHETIYNEQHKIGDIVKLELQLNEDCNAACIMCSDFNSTTWRKYNENTLKHTVKIHHTTTVEQRIAAVESTIDFESVRQIHFFGGEPFNTDTHLRIIKQVKNPEKTNLVYVTNCSVFPSDETVELWKQFKNVNIACSIDGIGEHFNYIRWPLRWDQVENILKRYRSMISKNFEMNCSFTGNPLNLYYSDRYTEWAERFFADVPIKGELYRQWFKNPHPVVGTVNLQSVPPQLTRMISEKYSSESRIYKIIDTYDPVKYQKFIDYVEYHDHHRKLNFRHVFPEVAEYFKNTIDECVK
jgi:hypothetical protein